MLAEQFEQVIALLLRFVGIAVNTLPFRYQQLGRPGTPALTRQYAFFEQAYPGIHAPVGIEKGILIHGGARFSFLFR